MSNFIRLMVSVMVGMAISFAIMIVLGYKEGRMIAFPLVHFGLALPLLMSVRSIRQFVRELFCRIHVRRMMDEPSISRTLVFGAGLRYRAFRRELVRKILAEKRVIVGLVDDDILLRGKYIGGMKVDGPHIDAKRIVEETKADSVVIACELTPERLHAVVESFKSCGLKVSHFTFAETEL